MQSTAIWDEESFEAWDACQHSFDWQQGYMTLVQSRTQIEGERIWAKIAHCFYWLDVGRYRLMGDPGYRMFTIAQERRSGLAAGVPHPQAVSCLGMWCCLQSLLRTWACITSTGADVWAGLGQSKFDSKCTDPPPPPPPPNTHRGRHEILAG